MGDPVARLNTGDRIMPAMRSDPGQENLTSGTARIEGFMNGFDNMNRDQQVHARIFPSAEIRFAPLKADGSMIVGVNDEKLPVRLIPLKDDTFTAIVGARRETVRIYQENQTIFVHERRGVHTLTAIPYLTYISAVAETSGELRAPMMGMILKVNVAVGDTIKAGDVAAVLESMKMELRINCEIDGVVTAVNCRPGETVERNAVVVVVEVDQQP